MLEPHAGSAAAVRLHTQTGATQLIDGAGQTWNVASSTDARDAYGGVGGVCAPWCPCHQPNSCRGRLVRRLMEVVQKMASKQRLAAHVYAGWGGGKGMLMHGKSGVIHEDAGSLVRSTLPPSLPQTRPHTVLSQ